MTHFSFPGERIQRGHDPTGLGGPALHHFLQSSWALPRREPLHHRWAHWYLGNVASPLSSRTRTCLFLEQLFLKPLEKMTEAGLSFDSAFPSVARLCAVLHDDVGGPIWSGFSEGRQRCSGCPESSQHPAILQVIIGGFCRSVNLLYSFQKFKKRKNILLTFLVLVKKKIKKINRLWIYFGRKTCKKFLMMTIKWGFMVTSGI